jgi:hypothetical protein
MKFGSITTWIFAALLVAAAVSFAFGQQAVQTPYQSQELSDGDGIPVLIKHLPDWENLRDRTAFVRDTTALRAALGERPVFDLVDFSAGTEAVTAPYPAGKLLIIEYTTPQVSVESDAKFAARLAELGDTTTVYRRIGNYSVFVFDGADTAAATELLEQVKYEKNVQWLGDDPYYLKRAERAFINTTSGIFTSTVFVILIGIGLAITGGLIVGITYFTLRVRRRAAMTAYTDAGGMTRLNLDGFTPDIVPERLLGD